METEDIFENDPVVETKSLLVVAIAFVLCVVLLASCGDSGSSTSSSGGGTRAARLRNKVARLRSSSKSSPTREGGEALVEIFLPASPPFPTVFYGGYEFFVDAWTGVLS